MCPAGDTGVPSPWLLSTAPIKPGSCVTAHPAFPQHPHFFPKPHQVSEHHKALPAKAGWEILVSVPEAVWSRGCSPGQVTWGTPGAVQVPCCVPQLLWVWCHCSSPQGEVAQPQSVGTLLTASCPLQLSLSFAVLPKTVCNSPNGGHSLRK